MSTPDGAATEPDPARAPKPKPTMRQTAMGCGCLTVLVVIVVVVLVNVFSGTSSPTATPTTPAAAPISSNDPRVLQIAFVALVKQDGFFAGKSDTDLVNLGEAVCVQRATDQSIAQVLLTDAQSGDFANATDAGRFVGMAVAAFCPQYTPEIDALAGSPTGH
jgi:hypothetical protein